jgi:hypothetical protein
MKKIILALFLGFSTLSVNAQDYYHGLGGQYNVALFSTPGSTEGASVPGAFYKSTLILKDDGPNFGISAYPFLGFNLSANTRTGGSGSFGASLPVLAEVYFGDADDACFYTGVGFSASYMSYADEFGGASGTILGPQVGLGGQFYIADNLIGLRASYTYGVNRPELVNQLTNETYKVNKQLFSIGIYYMLGQ